MRPEGSPRFVVDHMVGRLVTWLRLMGYDTLFAGNLDDPQIAHLAQQDCRILLTRDRELARRKSIHAILISSERIDEQLAQVVRECDLGRHGLTPRCTLCNGTLDDLPKEQARGHVPDYVFRTQERFMRCASCGHIYWQGTHWEKMLARLEAALSREQRVS